MKRVWVLTAGAVVVLAAAVWVWRASGSTSGGLEIETAEVTRGDVRRIVSTSGSVRALVTVEVGSQLSGKVLELNADFNTLVSEGDLIARIDPQTFESRVREAEAAVASARSTVALQAAGVGRAKANLRKVELEYNRTKELADRGTSSQSALEAAVAALASARADVTVAESQVLAAEATLGQREAAYESSKIDLERTLIRSPIDGIVVDRQVDVGQTVAASLSAPTLFTIAQDLTRVQIDAQVDEADIGQVDVGQETTFSVDAFPDVDFSGTVDQIRLAPTELQNVVTYTVVISAENPGRRLLPGMTANVDIVTGARAGVLTAPNQALRFEPRGAVEALVRDAPDDAGGGRPGGSGGGGPGGGGGGPGGGVLDRVTGELGLSDEQVERAQAAVREVFAQARSSEGGVDRDLIRARMNQAIESVLTPDQITKFRALQDNAQPRRSATLWIRAADGTISPRRIFLGVSDDRATEILGGQIEEGDLVVVRAREAAT